MTNTVEIFSIHCVATTMVLHYSTSYVFHGVICIFVSGTNFGVFQFCDFQVQVMERNGFTALCFFGLIGTAPNYFSIQLRPLQLLSAGFFRRFEE